MTRRYKAYGPKGINTCYTNIKKLCSKINIDPVTEKMCRKLVDSKELSPQAILEIGLWSSEIPTGIIISSSKIREKSVRIISSYL